MGFDYTEEEMRSDIIEILSMTDEDIAKELKERIDEIPDYMPLLRKEIIGITPSQFRAVRIYEIIEEYIIINGTGEIDEKREALFKDINSMIGEWGS